MNIKDETKTQRVGGVRLPKLKGTVCIQLFNAKTGKLEKEVKGENLVTNAIRDIFAANNLRLTDYSPIMPISKNLFGGILCFENVLTEDADSYYLPKSSVNPITAHAGQTTYAQASDDSTRGLPNDQESGMITDGYSFVWNFPETQGNGKISALALCPKDLGDWAMRGGTSFFPFTRLDMLYKATSYIGSSGQRCPSLFDLTNRRAFVFVVTSSSVTVRELKDFGAIQDIGVNQNPINVSTPLDYEDHTFSITNANQCYILYYQGNIHFLYASGASITRTIINTSTWTTSSDSLTVAGASLSPLAASSDGNFTDIDSDGYVYFLGSSKIYKVNYTNLADVIAIDRADNDSYIRAAGGFSAFGKYCHVCTSSKAYIIEGSSAHECARSVIGNPIADTRYICGTDANGYATGMMKASSDLVRTIGWTGYAESMNTGAGYANAMSKLFLSTIKNLQTPVTKTATQTMKITYSITEVQEGE